MRLVVCGAFLFAAACSRAPAPDTASRKVSEHQYQQLYGSVLSDFFARAKGKDGSARYAAQRLGATSAPSFDAAKPAGVLRVFVVGGSVAQLFDERELEAALRRLLPGRRFEVLDCGVSAYDSTRDGLTVEEVLGYEPDLVVLMSGVNEGGQSGSLPRSRRLLARVLAKGMLKLRLRRAFRLFRQDAAQARSLAGLAASFRENLRAAARAARARRVPLVLCTLPWNFRDMPPRGTMPLWERGFFDAWVLFERGDYPRAAEAFERYVSGLKPDVSDTRRTFGEYYLGRSLDRAGDAAGARAHYLLSLERQTPPMPVLNRIVREVGREEGVPLADLDAAFSDAAPGGLVGMDAFEDDMHWDRALDPLVAERIAAAAFGAAPRDARPLVLSGKKRREKAWVAFTVRAWGQSLYRDHRLAERFVALMDVVHEAHPQLLAHADEMKGWLREKFSSNVWDSSAALRLDEWWPAVLGHIGEVYLRRGEPGQALRFFDESLRSGGGGDTATAFIRLRRAVAQLALGRRAEALKAFEELRASEGMLPEIGYYRELAIRDGAAPAPRRGSGRAPGLSGGPKRLREEGDRVMSEFGAGPRSE
ncbi:MAG: tetratricopeptide repeat protein [Elusimicrobiota bacterium]